MKDFDGAFVVYERAWKSYRKKEVKEEGEGGREI